jgi:hypothetical protein
MNLFMVFPDFVHFSEREVGENNGPERVKSEAKCAGCADQQSPKAFAGIRAGTRELARSGKKKSQPMRVGILGIGGRKKCELLFVIMLAAARNI